MLSPKATIDALMDVYAALWDDPKRAEEPMYLWGDSRYGSIEGTYPLIRCIPTDFTVAKSDKDGDLCALNQVIVFEIWGEDHEDTLDQLRHLLKAINILLNPTKAPEGLSVHSILGLGGSWTQGGDHQHGKHLTLTWQYRASVPDFDKTALIERIYSKTHKGDPDDFIEDTIE